MLLGRKGENEGGGEDEEINISYNDNKHSLV